MKKVFITVLALTICSTGFSDIDPNYKLPENGKIQIATLTGSYSCEDAGKFKMLNLNGETHHDGNYYGELQINFSCGSTPEIEGTDLSLIAEVGDKKLTDLNYYTSLAPKWQVGQSYEFKRALPIKENMTYALLLNTFKYRGLMVFKVISYKQNVLTIEYATRHYSLIKETQRSDLITQDQKNSY